MTYVMDKPQSAGGQFLKLEAGKNKLRIISPMVSGWEGWNRSLDTPKVFRQREKFTTAQVNDKGFHEGKQGQFYACIVYSYAQEKFMTWTFKQKAISNGIYSYVTNEVWGDPTAYDIEVEKTGSGMETKYQVMPNPKVPFSNDVSGLKYELSKLFEGGDPLEADDEKEEVQDGLPF